MEKRRGDDGGAARVLFPVAGAIFVNGTVTMHSLSAQPCAWHVDHVHRPRRGEERRNERVGKRWCSREGWRERERERGRRVVIRGLFRDVRAPCSKTHYENDH